MTTLKDITNYITLIGTSVGAASITNPIPDVEAADKILLAIAAGSYGGLILTDNEGFRYFDWAVTTPLLLYTYWRTAQELGWNRPFQQLGVNAILMSYLGYVADSGKYNRDLVTSLSYVFFIMILIEIFAIQQYLLQFNNPWLNSLAWFFYVGWTLYGITFYLPKESRSVIWNILDFINKPIYSLVLSKGNQGLVASGFI